MQRIDVHQVANNLQHKILYKVQVLKKRFKKQSIARIDCNLKKAKAKSQDIQ